MIKQLKKKLCDTSKMMYDRGLVWCNGGNVSMRLPKTGTFLITPTGFNKGWIEPDDLVTIDSTGGILEGENKPSVEVNMHLAIYHERPEVNAVVHAHPAVATTLATLGYEIVPFTPEGKIFIERIGVVDYHPAGSSELAEAVKAKLEGKNVLVLKNHGALTFDEAILRAYYRMEELENTAKMNLIAINLGKRIPPP